MDVMCIVQCTSNALSTECTYNFCCYNYIAGMALKIVVDHMKVSSSLVFFWGLDILGCTPPKTSLVF